MGKFGSASFQPLCNRLQRCACLQDGDVAAALAMEEQQLRFEVQRRLDMRRAPVVVFKPDAQFNAQTQVDAVLDVVDKETGVKRPRE
jgi:ribosome-binding factor A